jgi:hypothetical protein
MEYWYYNAIIALCSYPRFGVLCEWLLLGQAQELLGLAIKFVTPVAPAVSFDNMPGISDSEDFSGKLFFKPS